MAAFSSFHHHHPFLLDSSVFLPNSSSTIDDDHNSKNLLPLHHLLHHQSSPAADSISTTTFNNFNHQNLIQNIATDHNMMTTSNDLSAPNKHSMDNSSSIVTDKHDNNNNKRKYNSKQKQGSSPNSAQSKDKREVKGKKQKKIKENDDDEEKKKKNINSKENNKGGYIHVRARRGQATDSHSLAERVRRERISERMKLLQTLVPGCDKVTGKALMLDEIINYVQSLQNQVEFLSMKLASVNPMFYDFGVDLESFMVRTDQDPSELPSPLPSMQECSPATDNNYNFLENIPANNPILFQQNLLPQPLGSRQSLWEVDEHRQKIINQSGFNSLFSFH